MLVHPKRTRHRHLEVKGQRQAGRDVRILLVDSSRLSFGKRQVGNKRAETIGSADPLKVCKHFERFGTGEIGSNNMSRLHFLKRHLKRKQKTTIPGNNAPCRTHHTPHAFDLANQVRNKVP